MASQIDVKVPVFGNPRTEDERRNWGIASAEITALQEALGGVDSPDGIIEALGYVPYDAANPALYQTDTQVTASLNARLGGSMPLMDGTGAVGVGVRYSREDHVHPTDSSRYAVTNPANYQSVDDVANSLAALLGTLAPLVDGVAAPGTAIRYSREDHIHPTDLSRYDATNPAHYQTDTQVSSSLSAALANYVPTSQKASPLGVASLDAGGKVPTAQLPSAATGTLNYRGGWNAATNTPAMTSGALVGGVLAPKGDYFVVTVGATTAAIDGVTTWVAGDWINSNGVTWERVQNSTSPYLPLAGGTMSGTLFGTAFGVGAQDIWSRGSAYEPGLVWSIRDGLNNTALALTVLGELWIAAIPSPASGSMPISKAYADATYLNPASTGVSGNFTAGGSITAVGALTTTAGPLTFPGAVYRNAYEPGLAWSVRDATGNIAIALGVAGDFIAAKISATDLSVANPFVSTSLTYQKDLINGQPANWLTGYTYGELIVSDGTNVSGGILPDGRWNLTIALSQISIVGADRSIAPSAMPGSVNILSCPANGGIKLTSAVGSVWYIQNSDLVDTATIWLPDTAQYIGNAVDEPVTLAPGSTTVIWQSSALAYATRKDKIIQGDSVAYTDDLINDNDAYPSNWLGGYTYDMTITDGVNISGGMLHDGRLHLNVALTSQSVVGGANLAGATQLLPGVIDVTSCPPGGGVQVTVARGGVWYVQNSNPAPINLWPASGTQFGVSGIGSPVTLESGSALIVWQVLSTKYGILQAGAGGGGGSMVFTGTGFTNPRDMRDRVADTVNVNDLVAGIDVTGVTDNSNQIRAAHDLAYAMGYRYLWFPARSKINAPFGGAVTAPLIYNVIFVGENCTINSFRKVIADPHAKSFVHSIDDLTPIMLEPFTAAVKAATPAAPAKVVILGHSGVDANQRNGNGGGLTTVLAAKLQKAYGNRPIEVVDRSIGGTAWIDLARNGPPLNAYGNDSNNPVWWAQYYETTHPGTNYSRRWIEFALDQQPVHALFLCHGANDNKNFDIYALEAFLAEVRARFNPVPQIFSIADYGRKMQDTFTGTYDMSQAEFYSTGYQRTYWRRNGVGFFDFGRGVGALRDGMDPVGGTLKNFIDGFLTSDGGNQNQIVTTLPWTFPSNQSTTNFSYRIGPAGNMNAVFAGGRKMITKIGQDDENILILEQDGATGHLAYTVQSINSSNTLKYGRDPTWPPPTAPYLSVPRTVTSFDLTLAGGLTIELDIRDGMMNLNLSSKSGAAFTQNNVQIKRQIDRYGGFFLPKIYWDTGATSTVNVLQAASYAPDMYMPQMTDEEFLPAVTLHIDVEAYRRLWWPVINQARFT